MVSFRKLKHFISQSASLTAFKISIPFSEAATGNKGVLENFAIYTGKQLCWSLFLINLKALRYATLLKKDPKTDVNERLLLLFPILLFNLFGFSADKEDLSKVFNRSFYRSFASDKKCTVIFICGVKEIMIINMFWLNILIILKHYKNSL